MFNALLPGMFSLMCGMLYSESCFSKLPFTSHHLFSYYSVFPFFFLSFFLLQYSFQEEVQKKPLPSAASQCCKLDRISSEQFCLSVYFISFSGQLSNDGIKTSEQYFLVENTQIYVKPIAFVSHEKLCPSKCWSKASDARK